MVKGLLLQRMLIEDTLHKLKKYDKREKFIDYEIEKYESLEDSSSILYVLSALFTFITFVIACCMIPWLFGLYIVVKICRVLFLRWLKMKFYGLEFVKNTTIRTAVDTRRNQGIITALLTVRGPCQLHLIQNRIFADIIERTRYGKVVFPHLRTVLTSRWGNYAWIKGSAVDFKITNHVVLANSTFKGRSITDANVQEYVSDIIAKLLCPEYPPWQLTVIPTQQDKTYLLIRLHHLYLSEDKLSLGELLLLRGDESDGITESDPWSDGSMFAGIFRTPVVIPQVYEQICESMSNWWNELLYKYDSIDNPLALKHPTIKSVFILVTIVIVSTIKEYLKNEDADLIEIFKIENQKRGVSKQLVLETLYKSLEPISVLIYMAKFIYSLPFRIIRYPSRIISVSLDAPLYLYWLYLSHFIIRESLYLFLIFYRAPRLIFEIFLPEHPCNVHQLQTMSFCGRKVVHWSSPVPVEMIKQIRRATGSTTSEVVMSAVSSSLRDYFEDAGFSVPKAVMTTCHFTAQEDLFTTRGQLVSGMLCLPLPTQTPKDDPIRCLQALRKSLMKARATQAPLYIASIYQMDHRLFTTVFPTLFAKACLYLLSRRYTVNVTQVDSTSRSGEYKTRQLLWGQRVEKIMYWRPPQANVGLSLTILTYGDTIQLGVMSDVLLSPYQANIVSHFVNHLYKLADVAGVPRILPKSSEPTQAFTC